jgi:fructose-bisphosphate aldolase class 1
MESPVLVINMEKGYPMDLAIKANIHHLAWYALICQSECLIPIVESDISLSGSHTLKEAVEVNICVQLELFKAMSTFLLFVIRHLFSLFLTCILQLFWIYHDCNTFLLFS